MVSEINPSSTGVVTALDSRVAKVDKPQAAVPTSAPGASDVVTLTDLGSRLQALTQSVADVPAVDSKRVEQFRQAIADGSYQVDAEAVADKLATFESMLTGPQGG
ncbi:MAG: flagellar biosynthesis anti-sigma factor FlgM [Gammaproteobacteria bacterium]|nr:flagellar biosynthesis anti-sigma factor FlgM [Gammaproteobacteria bacterium]